MDVKAILMNLNRKGSEKHVVVTLLEDGGRTKEICFEDLKDTEFFLDSSAENRRWKEF